MEQVETKQNLLLLRRLGAFIIDIALWVGLFYIVYLLLNKGALFGGKLQIAFMLTIFVIPAVYSILMWYVFGATVGMLCLDLRMIETQTGKKPILLISLLRYAGFFLSWFSLLIGFIWSLFDSRQQNFADKLASTMIISRKAKNNDIPKRTETDYSRWKVGKVFMLISILILIAVNIIWQYEEPLSNEAEAALINYAPDEYPQENGFYLVSAFGIPEDQSPFEVGFKRTVDMNEKILNILAPDSGIDVNEQLSALNSPVDKLDPELDVMHQLTDEQFITFAKENRELIKKHYNNYSYLRDRYYKFLEYDKYEHKIIPDMISPVPIMMPMVMFERLYVFNFVSEYIDGDRDEAIKLMQKGEAVCMHLMEQSDSLIFKLVSTIMMMIHQKGVDKLITYEENVDTRLLDYIDGMKPFSKEAWSMRKGYMHEYNLAAAFITRLFDSSEAILDYSISRQEIAKANPLFFKGNNIVNHAYTMHEQNASFSELPTNEMVDKLDDQIEDKYTFFEYLYNPLGVILSENYIATYNRYAVKVRDLEVRVGLMQAVSKIKRDKMDAESIVKFLNSKQKNMFNLYTDKPFSWDPETRYISFDGPFNEDTFEQRRIKL